MRISAWSSDVCSSDLVPAAMDTAPVLAAAGVEAPAGSLAMWRARSIEVARAQGIDDFEPSYLKLANAGDRNAVVEVTGESSRSLGPLGSVALDANTGELRSEEHTSELQSLMRISYAVFCLQKN